MFSENLFNLVNTCIDVLGEASKEELEYKNSILDSCKKSKSLLTRLHKDELKSSKIPGRLEPMFHKYFAKSKEDFVITESGQSFVNDSWMLPSGDSDASGYRGINLVFNEKKPNICVPFGEVYAIADLLGEKSNEDYGYLTARMYYRFLSLMACMEVKNSEGDVIDTEDIDLVAADIEERAKIKANNMGDMMKDFGDFNFDSNSTSEMLKKINNDGQLNTIIGGLSGLVDKFKDGNMGDMMSNIAGMLGDNEPDGDPAEQE